MLGNNQRFRVVRGEMPQESNFDQSLRVVETFGQLYKLIDAIPAGFVDRNGKSYSPKELRALVDEVVEEFKFNGKINVSRLSEVSVALAEKFPELIKRWYKNNAELELDA